MTTWTPCSACGADGYKVRPAMIGWVCYCPACESILTSGATRSQAIMFYTATYRRVQA